MKSPYKKLTLSFVEGVTNTFDMDSLRTIRLQPNGLLAGFLRWYNTDPPVRIEPRPDIGLLSSLSYQEWVTLMGAMTCAFVVGSILERIIS
jgi:hypothetical protein